ncbi:RES family NAD+ phosphorylase [Marinimicrobium locisalis]|uniref:RES family NAD+ phosphorylase n=1 Tax=Marinimicrobium locisalis TaxID=546022 RepID=UPI0032219024
MGRCDFCRSDNVATVDPDALTDLFELTKDTFILDEEGERPSVLYAREFRILSEKVRAPDKLWDALLGEEFNSKRYRLPDEVVDNKRLWLNFKEELIFHNRYFPQNNAFQGLFSVEGKSEEFYLFASLVAQMDMVVSAGDSFFRARISDAEMTSDSMGKPPRDAATGGRANPPGISYLYVSDQLEASVNEVRPSIGSKVWVAEYVAAEDLRIIDLTDPKLKGSVLRFEESEIKYVLKYLGLLELFSNDLSKPVLPHRSHLEYVPTQYICEFLKNVTKSDGIRFSSSFGCGRNLVLFDDAKLSVQHPRSFLVENTRVMFSPA